MNWISSSLSVFLTSCLYLRLSSTQPRRSMRRSRRECLISTMRWDILSSLFPSSSNLSILDLFFRQYSPLFQSLLFLTSFSSVWFSSSVTLPLFSKRGEKTLFSSSFDSSQAKLPMFLLSPALFSTLFTQLSLSLFLSLSFFLSLFFSLSLSASCQLINSSHPTRSQSFSKKTNTQPASQSVSCLSSQAVSLLSSQPDGYLLSGTVIQAGKSRHQACQQVCTCQQVLITLLPHWNY